MILFLDFDGVLHPLNREEGTLSRLPQLEITLRKFNEIDIVISSAWRQEYSLTQLRTYFSDDIQRRILDVTPVLDHLDNRYLRQAEIDLWLRDAGREYEGWIALDDSEWLFPPGCRNLILVDPEVGFDEAVEDALHRKLTR
ncbi:HAD domain-containing protein [Herbaspirillum sp. NPDC101397]|uniref:HAD domain-containing protein n=1 Tax=Herbaspirillum sp. NPDC101397 TaxID=3364006 RepID=UPI00383B149D